MDLLQWFRERWQREAAHYPYWKLPSAGSTAAKAGEHYFKLSLTEMFLKNERDSFKEWQPAAYFSIRFRFGDKDEVFNRVVGPSDIKEIQSANLSKGVGVNYTVMPLLPFNGGEIELEAGLVAVPGKDDVERFLKVLGDFSKVLAVPQLSSALSFAVPLAAGISDLVGTKGNKLALRLHDTFSAAGENPLRAQHLVVVSDPAGALDRSGITVEEGRLRYRGTALNGYDYFVLRIDTAVERDDYESLSAIEQPFLAAIDTLQNALNIPDAEQRAAMLQEAERRLGAAKLAAFRAKELTRIIGRNQAVRALQARFNDAKALLSEQGAVEQTAIPRSLRDVMAARISVEKARRLGEMLETDLLDVGTD